MSYDRSTVQCSLCNDVGSVVTEWTTKVRKDGTTRQVPSKAEWCTCQLAIDTKAGLVIPDNEDEDWGYSE